VESCGLPDRICKQTFGTKIMALLTKQENKHFHVFPIAFGQI
jgi:hypothetical protein